MVVYLIWEIVDLMDLLVNNHLQRLLHQVLEIADKICELAVIVIEATDAHCPLGSSDNSPNTVERPGHGPR